MWDCARSSRAVRDWTILAIAAALAMLVLAPSAGAVGMTSSNVTSPADGSFYNPVTDPDEGATISVTGTSDGTTGENVDIHCVYSSNGTQNSVLLNSSPVPLDAGGNFSASSLPLGSLSYYACRLIAVPAGATGPYDTTAFQGPRIGVGGAETYMVSGGPNDGAVYGYYQAVSPFGGYSDGFSIGYCFLGSTYLITSSTTLNYLPNLFGCASIDNAPNPPIGVTTHGGLVVDGNESYLPAAAAALSPAQLSSPASDQRSGFPAIQGLTRSFNSVDGTVTLDASEQAAHCGGFPASNANCAAFTSSNLRIDQHVSVEDDGRSIVYDHDFVNTGTGSRQVEVDYQFNVAPGDPGYAFPGQGAFEARTAGDTIGDPLPPIPTTPATVRVLGDISGIPCALAAADQCGALTWSARPTQVYFTSFQTFFLHYSFVVPEGGDCEVSLAFAQSGTQSELDTLAAAAEADFASNTCHSPPPGSGGGSPSTAGPTGQRAAALKKCKKKRGQARKRCIKKAKKLPL